MARRPTSTAPTDVLSRLILRKKDICHECGFSIATLDRLRASRTFPPPIRLGPQLIGWRRQVVEEWLSQRPREAH